mmetsp:Transcript_4159/g.6582  ORF Transcript_4159/g.6582 Transcript_4159/m.6582 type:complete len:359 (+) Transcript_4159:2-1078(+)
MHFRIGILAQLQSLIQQEWPQTRLQLFGSSGNNFCTKGSDLDLCLHVPDAVLYTSDKLNQNRGKKGQDRNEKRRLDDLRKKDLATFITKLGQVLKKKSGIIDVETIPTARVPIVKFKCEVPGVEKAVDCDLCINNLLACINTELLYTYTQMDWRLRPLVYCIKAWTKARQIHDPYRGYLSSYTYTLMVIHCLQVVGVLPNLQEFGRQAAIQRQDPSLKVKSQYDCYFSRNIEQLQGYGEKTQPAPLGALLIKFFQFYAREFSIKDQVVCVRKGFPITKKSKNWEKPREKNRHVICIEDPFDVEVDLGRYVDEQTLKDVVEELNRAYNILKETGDLSKVLEEWLSESDAGAEGAPNPKP